MGALVSTIQTGVVEMMTSGVSLSEAELWTIPYPNNPEEHAKWVLTPVGTQSTFRLVQSDWIEPITKNYWWMVPTLWLPIVLLGLSHTSGDAGSALTVLTGLAAWFPFEYVAHRFVFHCMRWPRLQFVIHGLHHRFPLDAERLVFPAAPAMFAALLLWRAASLVTVPETSAGLMSGFTMGYIVYDLTHYALHYAKWSGPLTRHHRIHHYTRPDMNFGITTRCFDRLCGTLVEPSASLPTAPNE